MNKKFSFIYLLLFSIFLNLKSDNTKTLQSNQTPQEQTGTSLIDSLKNIKDLDYYKSKDLTIYLPNNYKLIIDWGFTGSGDIFTPNPELKISYLENNQDSKTKKEFSLLDLTKVLIKNELNKQLKSNYKNISQDLKEYLPQFAWLANILYEPSNSALKIFSLKLFLLLKNYLIKQDETEFTTELLNLFVRLAQSNIKNLTDKNLSSFLPKDILDYINQNKNLSKLISLLDNLWSDFSKLSKEYKSDQAGAYDKSAIGKRVIGYAFQNHDIAKKVSDYLNTKNITNEKELEQELKELANIYKFEIVKNNDFDKYKNLQNYNFVTKYNFGRINSKSNSPDFIKTKILELKEFPKILLTEKDNMPYVLFANDNLDIIETLELINIALIKTFKDFEQIQTLKKEDLKPTINNKPDLTLESLNKSLEDLKIKMTVYLAQENLLKKEIDKWKNCVKNQLSKTILQDLEEKYQKLLAQKEICLKEVKSIQKQIQAIQITEASGFKALIKAFNSTDQDYLQLKETLFKQIRFILNNSEHIQDNLQVYDYLVKSIFPSLAESYKLLDKGVLA